MSLGIDYGYRQVKALELLKTEQKYTISKIGIQPVQDGEKNFDPENIGDEVIESDSDSDIDDNNVNSNKKNRAEVILKKSVSNPNEWVEVINKSKAKFE